VLEQSQFFKWREKSIYLGHLAVHHCRNPILKFCFKYRLNSPEDYALEEAVKPAGDCDPSVALEVDT
jgi:hypothetical protein